MRKVTKEQIWIAHDAFKQVGIHFQMGKESQVTYQAKTSHPAVAGFM
jgi:hypothetical protein